MQVGNRYIHPHDKKLQVGIADVKESPLQRKNMSGKRERGWKGLGCLKLVRNIHESKFTRRILQTRFAVGISSWFPESVFKRSFSWFLGVERQLWNVARTGGIGIDRAESTLLRYSISTDSCCAPRSEMY